MFDAVERGPDRVVPVEGSATVAFGINVPVPLGNALVLQAIRATEGTAVAVSDEDIVAEVRAVTAAEGRFVCPEGAACFVAARRLREEGWLAADDEVVVLNTGTGLVYPYAAPTPCRRCPATGGPSTKRLLTASRVRHAGGRDGGPRGVERRAPARRGGRRVRRPWVRRDDHP